MPSVLILLNFSSHPYFASHRKRYSVSRSATESWIEFTHWRDLPGPHLPVRTSWLQGWHQSPVWLFVCQSHDDISQVAQRNVSIVAHTRHRNTSFLCVAMCLLYFEDCLMHDENDVIVMPCECSLNRVRLSKICHRST